MAPAVAAGRFYQPIKVQATKSSCQCHGRCVPNKKQVLAGCRLSLGRWVGGWDGVGSVSWRFQTAKPKLKKGEILSRMTLSFSGMF